MANRTGTYVAFDGLGESDPTKSDYRYYSTLLAWSAGKSIDFKLVDSHDKTNAVRDTSSEITLKTRIQERLRASKQIVVILSDDTRKTGSFLSYEIEQAVDTYNLPLICVYTGYDSIFAPSALSSRWPRALEERINNQTAKAIHIPYKKNALLNAISRFYVNGGIPNGSLDFYNREAHIAFGCIEGP